MILHTIVLFENITLFTYGDVTIDESKYRDFGKLTNNILLFRYLECKAYEGI